MHKWRFVSLGVVLLAILCASSVIAREWGIGISSEPMDIAGGGFFLDSFVEIPLVGLRDLADLGLRASFGLGPLPIDPRVLFLDAFVVWRLDIGELNAYVGLGPSFMVSTSFVWTDLDAQVIVGIDGIRITEPVTIYIEVKIRGTGFFMSPGVGVVFDF